MRHLLSVILADHGWEARAVASAPDALREIEARDPDLVLTDVRMPGMDGLALLKEIQRLRPDLTVIVMSAYGAQDAAIAAMKAGAYDYLSKPFKRDEVVLVIRKAEERERLARENRRLRTELAAEYGTSNLVGASAPMREVLRQIRKVAPQKTTVLLQGESGTGKELVARALHDQSPRAAFPFVAVNCGAIPSELIESELFGHVKGAFTDASRAKKGLAEEADGGTLFLDEIGELPLLLQVKLLRFLEDEEVRPLGDGRARRRGDWSRPAARRGGRSVPGGSPLPARRGRGEASAAPGAAGGYRGALGTLPRALRAAAAGALRHAPVRRGARGAARAPLARQRARARARARTRRRARGRAGHPRGGPARLGARAAAARRPRGRGGRDPVGEARDARAGGAADPRGAGADGREPHARGGAARALVPGAPLQDQGLRDRLVSASNSAQRRII